jgi:Kef-type K+ transport system membrane component KefB
MFIAIVQTDPSLGALVLLAAIWLAAKAGGELATRLKLPTVVGELAAGMVMAACHRSWIWFPDAAGDPSADLFASVGVVLLMFSVGLESTVPQMLKVGLPALRVAVAGVVMPVALGLGAAYLLIPGAVSLPVALFIGACLCATSVGISARVLSERNAGNSQEGRVILGAAVIDDVLGLLVLVLVSGMAVAATTGEGTPWRAVGGTLALAVGFLGLALSLGRWATPHLFRMANRFRVEELLLPTALAFGFLMAWVGGHAGLAPIVGGYAAGLILEPAHVEFLEERERKSLEALVHPLVTALAPIFFVVMGARVDPRNLMDTSILALALSLTLLGALGKYLAGFAAGKGFDPHLIGWGMMPRGEVGLIFVATGAQLGVLSGPIQSAVVAAMMLTTVMGPIGLSWLLNQHRDSVADSFGKD